jgi:hypothetical protein
MRRQCGDRTAFDGPQVNPGVREATAAFTAEGAAILDRVPVLAISGPGAGAGHLRAGSRC